MDIITGMQILFPIMAILYVGFCWVKQGAFIKNRGWLTREEAPKSFWFNIIFFFFIGMFTLTFNILMIVRK